MSYTIIRQWTDGARKRWFTVAWADGTRTTHYYTVT